MPATARAEASKTVSYVLPVRDQSKGAGALRIARETSPPNPHGASCQRSFPLFRVVRSGLTARPPAGVDGDSQHVDVHHAPATEQPALSAADQGSFPAINPAPAPSSRRQLWSAASVAILCGDYPTAKPVREMSAELGRSVGAVYGKARRIGLKRPRRGAVLVEAPAALPVPASVPDAPQPDVAPAPEPPLPTPPATPPPPATLKPPPPAPEPSPAAKAERTKMGGRAGRWTKDDGALSERLERLFIANFTPGCIAAVLGVTERAAATRAWVVNCPRRDPQALRHDVEAARLVDRQAAPLPRTLHSWKDGKPLVRKRCRRKGHFIWGTNGTTLSNDALRQRSYRDATASGILHAW